MAGQGPAPKAPEERASFKVPERGDWLSLPPLEQPVLPTLPKGNWSTRARRMWTAWRADWVTQAYGPAEIAMALEAIYLFERMVIQPQPAICAEFRQWVDRLGLNLKGKRDLRLRQAPVSAKAAGPRPGAQLGDLRLVDDVAATA